MATTEKKTAVTGSYVARSAKTGRFVAVQSSTGRKIASSKTASMVKIVSEKRKSALKRLADR